MERARAAVDHHDGELDREDHRRKAAIAERQALGAEAANYARLLMAGMLRDPAKTGLTETGPTPQLPAPPDNPQPPNPTTNPARHEQVALARPPLVRETAPAAGQLPALRPPPAGMPGLPGLL